ncbi:Porin D [compost metagenome]
MHNNKLPLLALSLTALTGSPLALAAQADSQGFVADSHLDFLARNLYWNHNATGGKPDNREWGQGLRLEYRSGYTQGTVGFGVDLHGYAALKLDGGRGHAGRAGVLVPDDEGARDEATSAGGAVKLRVSNTELKYGQLRPYNPVFAPADVRLLPSTATGFWLTSSELEGLDAEAGHFTAAKDFNSTDSKDDFFAAYAGVATDTVDFLGGSYRVDERLSLSLYASEYRDIWRQSYANANYTWPLDDTQSLNLDFNLYRADDEGRALAGEIDVTAWSLAAAYRVGAHTFKLSHQRIDGDQPFDYLGMGPGTFHDSIYLANSSQLADFNGPREKSWGAFYSLDLAGYGVPGLSFHARYIRGDDVDGSHMDPSSPYAYYADDEKHWERDVDIKYVVQGGPAQHLSLRLRHATHRISGTSDSDADQLRLIVEYPHSFF